MLSAFATKVANFCTRPAVFAALTLLGIVWIISGFVMQWSDLWHKIMDIPATLLSFLLYFVILSAQNTDNIAVQAKLDELIDAIPGARAEMEHLEELSEEEIDEKRL